MKNPHLLRALIVLAATGSVALGVSCSATSRTVQGTGSGGSGGLGGAHAGPSVGVGGAFVNVGGGLFGSSVSSGPACATHCSSDLHSVVDCNGQLVSTCPADQGCGAQGCVPACQAAQENKSTIGCDYYAIDAPSIEVAQGSCFAAFITNTWTSPVTIAVERAGQTFDASTFARVPSGSGQSLTYAPLTNGMLDPGQVAIVFLAGGQSSFAPCPAGITTAISGFDPAQNDTGIGAAFHLTTSAPVVAYDIFPYGGGQSAATSATLLLPTTAWDVNYIAVDAFRRSQIAGDAQPYIAFVAAEDGTQVTINPTTDIVGGTGVAASPQGVPQTYALDKGQILQLAQPEELIGSAVQSNKPIGMWGGATCLNIDVTSAACDTAHQQIPPIRALGAEYAAVRYRNRFDGQEESPPWRLVGAVDGTMLTYDPAAPVGAPTSLSSGQVAEFRAPGPFVVKSQSPDFPFYMSGHMTGCTEVSADQSDCRGDPEFVNVIPPQQYLASYVFFTDPTYPETNLVLVRQDAGSGFKDVTLDCAGVLTDWQTFDTAGKYQYTRIDLVRHNFAPQNGCDNGRHEIHSDAPFGLTVWGWGTAESGGTSGFGGDGFFSQAVSYAYPAGASVQPINTVVVPTLPQ